MINYIETMQQNVGPQWLLKEECFGKNYSEVISHIRERSGSVVECFSRDRGVAGSSLNCVTALCA